MRRLVIAGLLGGVVMALPAPVQATPITVGGGWNLVSWDCPAAPNPPPDLCADLGTTVFSPTSFEFSLATPGLLRFTDLFVAGDEFLLTINGSAYATSDVAAADDGYKLAGGAYFNQEDLFFSLSQFSKLELALGPGDYQLQFALTNAAPVCDNPNGACTNPTRDEWRVGAASARVDAVVPEPSSMFLLGTGLAGLAAARRRRRH